MLFRSLCSIQLDPLADRGEKYLKSLGFDVARIRVHGDVARVEVPVDRIGDLVREETREGIVPAFKEIGFRYITFDLQGFRSGSMDEVLPPVD